MLKIGIASVNVSLISVCLSYVLTFQFLKHYFKYIKILENDNTVSFLFTEFN